MNFLFIMPVIGQPRYSKRVDMFKNENIDVKISAFERNYHKGRIPNVEISILGKIEHGNYFKRLLIYGKSIFIIRKLAKNCDVVYIFELDLYILTYVATIGLNVKRIIEIGDIREIQTNKSFRGKLVRMLDKFFVKKSDLLVVTAPKFYEEYYKKWLGLNINYQIVENKIEKENVEIRKRIEQKQNTKFKNRITIGYFGLIRCDWSIEVLYNLVIKYPDNFEVVLAGFWNLDKNLFNKISCVRNIKFFGEYKSPDDLEKLYSSVDIVWALYPFDLKNKNMHWAKTNRFYESLFFMKPLITIEYSSDGEFVSNNNIGINIGITDINNTVDYLFKNITINNIIIFNKNIKNIEYCNFIYEDEAKNIIKKLKIGDKKII